MKLLYANDSYFYRYKEDYYSNGNYSDKVLLRYTSVFEEIRFISRQIPVNTRPNKSLVTTQRVNFVGVPNFKSIKSYYKKIEACKIIENEVKRSDRIIARLPSAIGCIAVKYAKKYNKQYLIEIVACTWDSLRYHRGITGKILAPYSYLSTRQIIKNAPYAIYVTNEFLQQRYPSHGKSIGCSDVTLRELNDNIIEERLNKIKSMDENKPIILGTIGNISVRYKRQEHVIEAISILNKAGHNYEYHLVGGGDCCYLKAHAKRFNVTDKIKFIGILPHDKIFAYLDKIDIYIQPSEAEGLPRAVVEAMSRACPTLGSDAGGIPELLNKDFIFHKGSIGEICSLLKRMNQTVMVEEAIRSFSKSKEYDEGILNQRRHKFYLEFKNSI